MRRESTANVRDKRNLFHTCFPGSDLQAFRLIASSAALLCSNATTLVQCMRVNRAHVHPASVLAR